MLRSGKRLSALKILIAPSAVEARDLRLGLARSGVSLVNVEAVTPLSLARLVVRSVAERGAFVDWDRTTVRAVVAWLMASMEWPDGHALAGSPALAADFVLAVRRRGVSAESWRRQGRDPHVAQLLEAYESAMRQMDARDAPGLVQEAIRLVSAFVARRQPTVIMWLDEVRWQPDERRLLDALTADVPVHGVVGATTAPQVRAERVLVGADRADEVARVVADIASTEIPLDRIQLAVAHEGVYEAECVAAGLRYGFPVTLHRGPALVHTVPGRRARAFLQWIAGSGDGEALERLVALGVIPGTSPGMHAILAGFPFDPLRCDEAGYVRELEREASRTGLPARAVADLAAFSRRYVTLLRGAAETASGLWSRVTDLCNDDADTLDALTSGNRALFSLGSEVALDARDMATWLLGALDLAADGRPAAEAGALLVVPLAAAGATLRPVTYVLGLDDGADVPSAHDDLSAFPERLVAGLHHPAPVPESLGVRAVVDRIRTRSDEVILCAPSFDIDDGRECFPHPALVAVSGLTALVPEGPRRVLDAQDAHVSGDMAELAVRWPAIQHALLAESARHGRSWSAWDGMVDRHGVPTPLAASPSALERLSICPHRYFLMDVLGIRPTERRTSWLTPLELGSLVHEVLSRLPAFEDGGGTQADAARAEVSRLLSQHAVLCPAPGPYAFAAAERAIHAMINTVLVLDASEDRRIIATEWAFSGVTLGAWTVKGRIDRVDRDRDGHVRILDYKTGSSGDYSESTLSTLQQKLQWALYPEAWQQSTGESVSASGYLFLNDREWGTLVVSDAPTHDMLVARLDELADRVRDGWFPQAADSPACRHCPVALACGDLRLRHESIIGKDMDDERYARHAASWWRGAS